MFLRVISDVMPQPCPSDCSNDVVVSELEGLPTRKVDGMKLPLAGRTPVFRTRDVRSTILAMGSDLH